MFDLIGQAFVSMGTFLQQATTGSPELDSIVSIVIAVAAIGGVIAEILKRSEKTRKYGQMIDTFAQKTVENEEMLYRGMAAVKTAIPEIEEPLKKHSATLETLKNRTTVGAEQLEILRALALGDKERAKTVEMPREKEPVF